MGEVPLLHADMVLAHLLLEGFSVRFRHMTQLLGHFLEPDNPKFSPCLIYQALVTAVSYFPVQVTQEENRQLMVSGQQK